MNTITKRILLGLAVLLVLATAVGLAFHPDPSCGSKPEPTGTP